MTTETGSLSIDDLAELRKATKTLWDSGVLQPYEKTHMWEIILRIDGLLKAEQDDGSGS